MTFKSMYRDDIKSSRTYKLLRMCSVLVNACSSASPCVHICVYVLLCVSLCELSKDLEECWVGLV